LVVAALIASLPAISVLDIGGDKRDHLALARVCRHGGGRLGGGRERRRGGGRIRPPKWRVTLGASSASPPRRPDGRDRVSGLGALEQEAAGSGAQRGYVLVRSKVVRIGTRVPPVPSGGDAGRPRPSMASDVHQDDIGRGRRASATAVPVLASPTTVEALGSADDAAEPGPDQGLIVGDDYPQRHRGPPSGRAAAGGSLIAPRPAAGTGR
jgi:hypothetical protein